MLTHDQINALSDFAIQSVSPVVDFLLEDVTRRIKKAGEFTSSAAYQIWKIQELGLGRGIIDEEIQKRLNVSKEVLDELLVQSAEVGYNFDISHLPRNAIPFSENEALQDIVSASRSNVDSDLNNITQTLGMIGPYGNILLLHDAYIKCCDYMFNEVAMGATDYNTALRRATRNLADKGILSIDYESGYHCSVEAAVRRNLMSSLGDMQQQISDSVHDEIGANGSHFF